MLQAAELDSATAQELINASQAVGWSNLYSILTKLAANTMSGDRIWAARQMWTGFQALHLLLSEIASRSTTPACTSGEANHCRNIGI